MNYAINIEVTANGAPSSASRCRNEILGSRTGAASAVGSVRGGGGGGGGDSQNNDFDSKSKRMNFWGSSFSALSIFHLWFLDLQNVTF